MNFPKDIVCIKDGNWGYEINGTRQFPSGPHPQKDKVYKALGLSNIGYYEIEGFLDHFYNPIHFRDIDDINISEVTEILTQEPCLL